MGVIEMVLKNDRVESICIRKKDDAEVFEVDIIAKGKVSGRQMYYKSLYSRGLIMTNKSKKSIVDLILKDLDMQEQNLLSKEKIIKMPWSTPN